MFNYIETAFFSFLEFYCAIICVLTIFRLPIRYHLMKIGLMSIIISIITTFTFATVPDFAMLINFTCLSIIITVTYQLPFFYSVLIASVLYLLGTILENSITSLIGNLLNVNLDIGSLGLKLIYVITGILYLVIAWLLQRKKLGFMFISKYFTMKNSLKAYNFPLSVVLFVSIMAAQAASILAINKSFSMTNFYLLLFITILFVIGIYIAYLQNKKQLMEKHKRLQTK